LTHLLVTEIPRSTQIFWSLDFLADYSLWIGLISGILGIIAFIGWVIGFRPRATCGWSSIFLDCKSRQIFQETKYDLNWGHVIFFRKIKLKRIERNATFRVLCQPLGKIKEPLPMANYGDRSASEKGREVYLTGKSFFRKEEIAEVYLETVESAPADCMNNIEVKTEKGKIEVLNRNSVELRDLPIILPKEITLEKMLEYSSFFKNWDYDPNAGITGFLSNVPACVGEKPGKVTIPLGRSLPKDKAIVV